MSLSARFTLQRERLSLELDFEVASGETLALVGPNGAGKSTCLQALAGLHPIDTGHISLAGETLDRAPDPSAGRSEDSVGTFVPPADRGAGFVFQDHVLFPNLSARDNVAYGLRARGTAREVARAAADAWLARVGLGGRGDAHPGTLSGGEAGRVALARALAPEPRYLLLDEPLAAVDASARAELRRELRQHLETFDGPRILVVHDALDAFALADRIAVLENGAFVQTGSLADICAQPRSAYVADLVGLNLFSGVARGGTLEAEGGAQLVLAGAPDGPIFASVHPRAVALFREQPDGSPRNVWRAPVVAVEPTADRLRIRIGGGLPLVAEVTPAALEELGLRPGLDIWVAVKATEVAVYSA